MPDAREHPRTDQEVRAREDLMREQFERDADAWEKAISLDHALKRLRSVLTFKK
jgi:hypothetical protein